MCLSGLLRSAVVCGTSGIHQQVEQAEVRVDCHQLRYFLYFASAAVAKADGQPRCARVRNLLRSENRFQYVEHVSNHANRVGSEVGSEVGSIERVARAGLPLRAVTQSERINEANRVVAHIRIPVPSLRIAQVYRRQSCRVGA